jgi:hypothetical protein
MLLVSQAAAQTAVAWLLSTLLDFRRYYRGAAQYRKRRYLTWRNLGCFTKKFAGLQASPKRLFFYHPAPVLSSPFGAGL